MKKFLSVFTVLLTKVLFVIIKFMPRMAITPLSKIIGFLFYITKFRAKVIKKNWEYIFDKEITKDELKKIFVHTSRIFIETLYFFTSNPNKVLDFFRYKETEKPLKDVVHEDSVFITMHYANWEVVGCYLGCNYRPFYPIYKKLANKYFENLMLEVRNKFYMFPIESKKIVKAMKKDPDKLYAFIIDQNLRQGNYYNFLGKDTLITDVPIKLSLKSQKKIIYGYPVRDENGNFYIESQVIETKDLENTQENIDKIMNEICQFFSAQIKKDPIQWYGWLHKFWKSTPENENGGIYKRG